MEFKVSIAIIDLTSGEISVSHSPDELVMAYLGGRGLNIAYLRYYLLQSGDPKGLDPLGPENPLIIGAGMLTGTIAPNAARFNVSAKSPESGILGDSNCGGFFAAAMRKAGFDRLIILGRAERPSYILLEAGGYFEQAKSHEDMIIRNYWVAVLEKMGIWVRPESRQASLQTALQGAFEKDIKETE